MIFSFTRITENKLPCKPNTEGHAGIISQANNELSASTWWQGTLSEDPTQFICFSINISLFVSIGKSFKKYLPYQSLQGKNYLQAYSSTRVQIQRKASNSNPVVSIIAEVDLCKFNPWELPDAPFSLSYFFFFCSLYSRECCYL